MMKSTNLRESEIHPSDKDPFKDDLLDRRELIESVAGALASFRESHVVAINGGYGTGKTTALRFLEALLRERGSRVAVLNAWEHDHRHPLESLLYATGRAFGNDDALMGRLEKAIKAVIPDLIAELGPPGTRSFGKQFVRRMMPDLSPIDEFRRRLTDVAKVDAGDNGGPVVLLIDELDRCRPDTAVGLLEWVKHAFSIDRVHFVFGVHLDQLSHTVKKLYGAGFDGFGYLERLIHMVVRLPPASVNKLVVRELDRRRVRELLSARDRHAVDLLKEYLVEARLSARAAIRAVALFDATLRMLPEDGKRPVFADVLTRMVLLKAAAPATFGRFVSGEATDADVVRDLEQSGFLKGSRNVELLVRFQAYLIHAHRYSDGLIVGILRPVRRTAMVGASPKRKLPTHRDHGWSADRVRPAAL